MNDAYEAVVALSLQGPEGQAQDIEAVIDTAERDLSRMSKMVLPTIQNSLTHFPTTAQTRFCLRRKYVHHASCEPFPGPNAADHQSCASYWAPPAADMSGPAKSSSSESPSRFALPLVMGTLYWTTALPRMTTISLMKVSTKALPSGNSFFSGKPAEGARQSRRAPLPQR